MEQTLIRTINASYWWNITSTDPSAYRKRGKFLASTYKQAEFYSRPNNVPEKVEISKLLWSDSALNLCV